MNSISILESFGFEAELKGLLREAVSFILAQAVILTSETLSKTSSTVEADCLSASLIFVSDIALPFESVTVQPLNWYSLVIGVKERLVLAPIS